MYLTDLGEKGEFSARVMEKGLREFQPERFNLLVIDDDDQQLKLLRKMLERVGFRVQIATSAPEGYSILERNYFDLVICDIKMPEVDGLSFVKHIKSIRTFPADSKIPVIMLTASGPAAESSAIAAGADGFCLKSEVKATLCEKVRAILADK